MIDIDALRVEHTYRNSVAWRLTPEGLEVDGRIETTIGPPVTVERIWHEFGIDMSEYAAKFEVPLELIVATAATETRGHANAVREEPGYIDDEATPHRVSPGLMQTLISTARRAVGSHTVDRAWLLVPRHSIWAGTAYMASQADKTLLDPPKVAAAYNAGGVYRQAGVANRWKMRQYPIGTGEHVDRFVEWFNDCYRLFMAQHLRPPHSFAAMEAGLITSTSKGD